MARRELMRATFPGNFGTIGSGWTNRTNTMLPRKINDTAGAKINVQHTAMDNTTAWPADHWAEVTVSTVPDPSHYGQVAARSHTDQARNYTVVYYVDKLELWETGSQLNKMDEVANTLQNGDRVGIEVRGSNIVGTLNGSAVLSGSSSLITGGAAGFGFRHNTPRVSLFVGGDFVNDTFELDRVNANDVILSGGPIVIYGSQLQSASTVKLTAQGKSHTLTITGQSQESITCQPVNIFSTPLPYGAGAIDVDGVTHAVTINPDAQHQYVVAASPDNTLLAKDITGFANGWQLATPKAVGNSTISIFPNTDARYAPAVPGGTVHTRWAWDPAVGWDNGTVTINPTGDPVTGPRWTQAPSAPIARVGVQFNYDFTNILEGTRPMTFALVGTPLPPGITLDSTAEALTGIPSLAGEYHGIVIRATNGAGAAEAVLSFGPSQLQDSDKDTD